jgi:methylmalonyl-CoA mutase cobalamin-binding subunit
MGIAAVFLPGTPMREIVEFVGAQGRKRVDEG